MVINYLQGDIEVNLLNLTLKKGYAPKDGSSTGKSGNLEHQGSSLSFSKEILQDSL
jgi:hypothetical protein